MTHILFVLGTRPEAIKLAPVIHTLRDWPTPARVTVCSTGQHREMLDSALGAFGIEADVDLNLMQAGQRPSDLVGRLMIALGPVLADLQPDVIAVQGDTATVTGAALAGFMLGTRVAHVEAGLRTRDKRAPFPEEVNRRVTGVVADHHFAPTASARDNLLREGTPAGDIVVTGNTVVDALFWMRDRVKDRALPAGLEKPPGRRLILVTAHRRESFGEPFRHLCHALREIAERFNDVELVYPVHLNPRVQEPVREILGSCDRVRLIEPQAYAEFVTLLNAADLILTDSGGIQEEAPALGKPTLVLREKTERPEAVAAGVVKLVGTDRPRIVAEATTLLTDPAAYAAMSRPMYVYGDGRAATRIGEVLINGQLSTPEFVAAT